MTTTQLTGRVEARGHIADGLAIRPHCTIEVLHECLDRVLTGWELADHGDGPTWYLFAEGRSEPATPGQADVMSQREQLA